MWRVTVVSGEKVYSMCKICSLNTKKKEKKKKNYDNYNTTFDDPKLILGCIIY